MIANNANLSDFVDQNYLYLEAGMNITDGKEWVSEYCYGVMSDEQQQTFWQFQKIVGGYFNCIFGSLGLVGNILSIMVLCRKEMRKNCFSQLLIGKNFVIFL